MFDTFSLLVGISIGSIGMIFLLAGLVLFPRDYSDGAAHGRMVTAMERVPDKVEPHPVTMHEPAPIQTHERHLVAYVGRPIREADVIQFPRRWDERSH